jgi:ABC-type lipoprotein export system ATPase subunit
MRILNLRFKNFNSYGNVEQELNFDTKEGMLYLLHGQSGIGKCLDPSTKLEINIKDDIVRNQFLEFLKNK